MTSTWSLHEGVNEGVLQCWPGASIQKLTDVKIEDVSSQSRSLAEKTAMVRAARQLLSAVTKVLIMADKVVVKQLVAAKDQVSNAQQQRLVVLLKLHRNEECF